MFASRGAAGLILAGRLLAGKRLTPDCVLAIANGGAPVARPVAMQLQSPAALCCISRIMAPGMRDLAIGAVYGPDGVSFLNDDIIRLLGLTDDEVIAAQERARESHEAAYTRVGISLPDRLADTKQILIVDDGISTGCAVTAAIELVSLLTSSEIIVTTPVISSYGFLAIANRVSEVIYLRYSAEANFRVRAHYRSFPNISPDEAAAQLVEFQPVQVSPYSKPAEAAHLLLPEET